MVLVLCFGMSFVLMVPSMWYLICGFPPPARSSIASVFGFFRLGGGLLSFCAALSLYRVLRIVSI